MPIEPPYLVIDYHFPHDLLRAADESWPDQGWEGWVEYEPPRGRKRASNLTHALPQPCADLLWQMSLLPVEKWFALTRPLVPDLGLWGAGLHEMSEGGELPYHLDADKHPRLGLHRRLTAVLYVHSEWEREWGGELVVGKTSPLALPPSPGRLVILTGGPSPWHKVGRVCCPGGKSRRSLALFWYGAPDVGSADFKTRAEFE